MSQMTQRRPRRWVLWVVRAVFALTILDLLVGAVLHILGMVGPLTGSYWWLIMGLPQVSVALLAILICWAPDSRPTYLGINVGYLLGLGLIYTLGFMKWLPAVIGALAILAMVVRPKGKPFIEESPPTADGRIRL